MITCDFSGIGKESLYKHLYESVKSDICEGKLAAGERLPSKRLLAAHLSISTITVENAYNCLMTEGYVYSLPKKGYYVADISRAARPTMPAAEKPARKNSSCETEKPALGSEKAKAGYIFDFISNHTRPENFPFDIWARLMREVITEKSAELMRNPPSGGTIALRKAIAGHLKRFRGMTVSHEQIIVGAGTEYLYSLLIQLLGHDKLYALEDPGYGKPEMIYRLNGAHCCHVGLDDQGINVSELSFCGAQVAHITPNHHYPTGLVVPMPRRYELLAWVSSRPDRYIIEDDYDCEFRLLGSPVPPLQSMDSSDRVIYINTFTKSLASTIRIAYMVLPPGLLEEFYRRQGFYACTVSNFEQYTLARLIDEGYFEKHIAAMKNYYRGLRDRLVDSIVQSALHTCTHIAEADAGLHFLLHVHTEMTDEELVARLEEHGIRIACLSGYYHDNSAGHTHALVMNYSGIDPGKIDQATARLVKVIAG